MLSTSAHERGGKATGWIAIDRAFTGVGEATDEVLVVAVG
jgi:hypothetical protein